MRIVLINLSASWRTNDSNPPVGGPNDKMTND